jgi:acetoin utilization deacetylase AcuC-like enzyme
MYRGCIFNNAAIAARHAQVVRGVERVAIVDFDVHHADGTQDIFWGDPDVMVCSTHEMPLYPGTGKPAERGAHNQIVNVPLKAGDGGEAFLAAYTDIILPRLKAFRPNLVVLSAGFDAHQRDRLSHINLDEKDFGVVTRNLMDVAMGVCSGRIVSVVEGGYDLIGLALSVRAHVASLMGDIT